MHVTSDSDVESQYSKRKILTPTLSLNKNGCSGEEMCGGTCFRCVNAVFFELVHPLLKRLVDKESRPRDNYLDQKYLSWREMLGTNQTESGVFHLYR